MMKAQGVAITTVVLPRVQQAEFLRRYDATPKGFKAERIGGDIRMASRVLHAFTPPAIPAGMAKASVSFAFPMYASHLMCARKGPEQTPLSASIVNHSKGDVIHQFHQRRAR